MSLKEYKLKRDFKRTPEPKPKLPKLTNHKDDLRFSIQLHAASRRHFDFRLELDGVMKSWAIPRGPSLDPNDQRLAVRVEDHPMDYRVFEGIIPKGNYGAGTVLVWDEGTYVSRASPDRKAGDEALRKGLKDGHLTFVLSGKKLKGEFALIKLKRGEENAWLLVKKRDGFHSYKAKALDDRSVLTGRTLAEITREADSKGQVWLPGKGLQTDEDVARTSNKKNAAKKTKQVHYYYEPEWDGYQAELKVYEGQVSLRSKRSANLLRKFPQLEGALKSLKGNVTLEGFVVLLDDKSRPRPRGQKALERKAMFYACDILSMDGKDTKDLPLTKRKTLLAKVLNAKKNLLVKENPFVIDAAEAEAKFSIPAVKSILTRAASSKYDDRPAKKVRVEQERPSEDVISSAKSTKNKETKEALDQHAHHAQNPVQKGKAPSQVILTNQKKIYWPAERYTKGDVLDYYRAVAPLMLPHIIDRPQSLNRHPNGIEGKSFFQKEVTGSVPPWLATTYITSGSGGQAVNYALCQSESALLFLANMGCIEINVWNARWQFINFPDYVVIDIDPGKIEFTKVMEVTFKARALLDKIEALSFCKTSGGRGMHIYIPLKEGKYTHDEAREFSLELSQILHHDLPKTTSLERSPAKRPHLIYLDYLQNRRGQTMAAPYSARPRPHAPVSMPLRWSEVSMKLNPLDYTIKTTMKRLDRLGDAWEKIYDQRNDLKQLKRRLVATLNR